MSLVLLIVLSLFVFVSFLVFVHSPCFLWESVLSVYISQSQVSVYFLSVSFLFSYLSLCVSRSLTLCVLVISLAMFLSLCFILCLPKSVFHVCFHVCLSSFQHQAHVFLSLFKTFESCKGLAFLLSGLSKVPVLCFVPKSWLQLLSVLHNFVGNLFSISIHLGMSNCVVSCLTTLWLECLHWFPQAYTPSHLSFITYTNTIME